MSVTQGIVGPVAVPAVGGSSEDGNSEEVKSKDRTKGTKSTKGRPE